MKYYVTILIKNILPAFLLSLFAIKSFSQGDLSSPYSMFGAGIPVQNMTVAQAGMGGSGSAFLEFNKMNRRNPAVLAYYSDPIFETSAITTLSRFSSQTDSYTNRAFRLDNVSLAMPIKRGIWGLTIGLEPYTTIGYAVNAPQYNSNLNTTPVAHYSGDGGINQGYIGTAYRVFYKVDSTGNSSSLAVGVNLNRVFGTVNHARQIAFPENPENMGTRVQNATFVRDWTLDFGIHYQTNLIKRTSTSNESLKLLMGTAYSLQSQLKAERNAMIYNFVGAPVNPADTIAILDMETGKVIHPAEIRAGIAFDYISKKRSRYRLAIDIATQQWSEYNESFAGKKETFGFRDNKTFATGLEYTPNPGSIKYLQTVEYRIGIRYAESLLNVDGTSINDLGMSFGFSLPLHHRRAITKSAFHISGQYGKFGTTDANLIQENYFKIYLGFSFTPHFRNRWFVQPKYD